MYYDDYYYLLPTITITTETELFFLVPEVHPFLAPKLVHIVLNSVVAAQRAVAMVRIGPSYLVIWFVIVRGG